jgi:hypothetical protein
MNRFLDAIERIVRNNWNYSLDGFARNGDDFEHHAEVCLSDDDVCGWGKGFDPGDALHFAIIDLENITVNGQTHG